ncbi:MAG: thiamine phosphate synthase [Longimicrobiales bacterium]
MIPPLHLITDDAILSRAGFLSQAREVMATGGSRTALHLRGPGLGGRRIFELAQALEGECRETGCLLLVNDRLDVALSLDLPGVHLGQRSLPPSVARELLGPGRTIGLSVHNRTEGEGGRRGEVDFLVVGTLFPTPSHPEGKPGGVDRLREVGELAPPPMVGIGGITPLRVEEVLDAGAVGVAVRGGIWEAPDPAVAAGVYLGELARCAAGSAEQGRKGDPGECRDRP